MRTRRIPLLIGAVVAVMVLIAGAIPAWTMQRGCDGAMAAAGMSVAAGGCHASEHPMAGKLPCAPVSCSLAPAALPSVRAVVAIADPHPVDYGAACQPIRLGRAPAPEPLPPRPSVLG